MTRNIDDVIKALPAIEAMGGKLPLVAEFPDRAPVMLAGIAAIDTASSRETAGHGTKK